MVKLRGIVVAAVWVLGMASVCWGWSNKEHIQLARLAAERVVADPRVPGEMKEWVREAVGRMPGEEGEREYFLRARVGPIVRGVDGLAYWATVPDMIEAMDKDQRKVEPFGVAEGKLHYIDVEFFAAGATTRPVYVGDLSQRPRVADFPHDLKDERYKQAGMLPFRVEDCYARLVRNLREGRMVDRPGQYPRDEHAAKWAGMLAHYVADSAQPHHGTVDYKSQSYFAGEQRLPNAHMEIEYRMCDDEDDDFVALREEYWPMLMRALEEVEDPVQTQDPWTATLEVVLRSYEALPLIGEAAVASAKRDAEGRTTGRFDTAGFFHHRGTYDGREMSVMEMKARQQAWAVRRIERLWRQAWEEARGAAGEK